MVNFWNRLIDYEENSIKLPFKKKMVMLLLYLASTLLSYILLLLLFTLDFGIYGIMVIGYTIGYAIYGFKRRKAYIYLYNPKADKC